MENLDEAKTTVFFDKLLANKGNHVIFALFNVLTFSCLICALNLYFAQKLLQKPKIPQKLAKANELPLLSVFIVFIF